MKATDVSSVFRRRCEPAVVFKAWVGNNGVAGTFLDVLNAQGTELLEKVPKMELLKTNNPHVFGINLAAGQLSFYERHCHNSNGNKKSCNFGHDLPSRLMKHCRESKSWKYEKWCIVEPKQSFSTFNTITVYFCTNHTLHIPHERKFACNAPLDSTYSANFGRFSNIAVMCQHCLQIITAHQRP